MTASRFIHHHIVSSGLAILLIAGGVMGFPTDSRAAQQAYDAVLSETSIPKGESVILQVRYQNCQPEEAPTLPEIPDLAVSQQRPQSSNSLTISQGRRVAVNTIIYPFQLTPSKEGTFVIPPISSTINGKTYKTKALQLRATKERDYSQYAFVKVRIPKQEVYVGETFVMAVDLYERNAKVEEKPTVPTDGFILDEIGNIRPSQTRVGNQIYNRLTIQYATRAVKEGELSIGPISWKVPLLFQNPNGRRQRSVFDSFMRDLIDLNSTIRKEVTLLSEEIKLNVLPHPTEDRPSEFNGAVGSYTMVVSASPTTVTAGDPITLRMRIEGRGALEALKMPSFDHWHDFKQYPETSKTDYSDEYKLSGAQTFEKVVIPNNAEVTEIPEIRFSFFDPEQGAYRTLTKPPIPLTVSPNTQAATQPTVIAGSETSGAPLNIATNIVHIKPHIGASAVNPTPWLSRPSFLFLNALPLILLTTSWIVRMRRDAAGRNPRAQREKEVKALVASGLEELRTLARGNRSEEFFALLFRLLQEQIGERIDQPATAITEAVVETSLRERVTNPQTLDNVEHLFQTCNQSRYAPIDSEEELNQLATLAATVLRSLQSLPPTQSR